MGLALKQVADLSRPVSLSTERLLPVLPSFEKLIGKGLKRGSVITVTGSTSLALALVAGPSAAGAWSAAVGMPQISPVAAAELGVALERFALVTPTASQWLPVVATLLEAVELIIIRPQKRISSSNINRLSTKVRKHGSVLICMGPWEGADLRLSVAGRQWQGAGAGDGFLSAIHLYVSCTGRGAASRPVHSELLLPAANG